MSDPCLSSRLGAHLPLRPGATLAGSDLRLHPGLVFLPLQTTEANTCHTVAGVTGGGRRIGDTLGEQHDTERATESREGRACIGEGREAGVRGHGALLGRERRSTRGGRQLLFSGGLIGGRWPGPEGPQREQGKCPNPELAEGYQGLMNVPGGWTVTLGNRQLRGALEGLPTDQGTNGRQALRSWLCPHSRVQHPAQSSRGKERAPGSRGWQREGQVTPALGGRAPVSPPPAPRPVPGDTGPAPEPQR